MQAIRFTRAMAPHGVGDARLVPLPTAERLEREGLAELGEFPAHPHGSDGGFVPYPVQPAGKSLKKVTK